MQPKVVFCTTCKGRAQHIKETLPINIANNPNSKFVLLDYSSDDDLIPYLKQNHRSDISSKKLVVYTFRTKDPFHVAHAKNMVARLGILEGADLLVTLDADNFTGPRFEEFIVDKFREPGIFLCPNYEQIRSLSWAEESKRPLRGFAGRLAVRTQDFIKAGGYNEVYNTWRGEDIDFNARMQRMGYTIRHIDNSYLGTIPHNAQMRFKEYPHAKQFQFEGAWKIEGKHNDTVVNFGQIGVGTVYKNFSSKPIKLRALPTRIFGIGLHKTATTSLHKAFQILGFDSLHWGTGEAPLIWQEMNTEGKSKTLERYYALSDLPIPVLYQKLDKAYPGSKFILTTRDEQKWLKSVEGLWDEKRNPTRSLWDIYPFSNRIHTVLYGQQNFDPVVMLDRYRCHNAEVKEYFKNRPQDLLVLDMEKVDPWPILCRFLGESTPSISYPKEYITAEILEYFKSKDSDNSENSETQVEKQVETQLVKRIETLVEYRRGVLSSLKRAWDVLKSDLRLVDWINILIFISFVFISICFIVRHFSKH
jgi:hypothetical protein